MGLRTPRVNPLIWNQIPAQVRTSDSKSQKTQNALVASIVAMMKATNLGIEHDDETTRNEDKKVPSSVLSRHKHIDAPSDEKRSSSRLLGPLWLHN